jgi:hypothetical protein
MDLLAESGLPEFNYVLLGVLVAANIPVYWLLYKMLFGNAEELLQAIAYWFTPDVFSLFRGEYMEDWWAEVKLGALISLSGAAVWFEYVGLASVLSGNGA